MKNKIEKLQNAAKKLKSEYVGIDAQIDKIIEQITPWYLTPEILTRPVVISLFSMTGTGKTSVVRKLLAYLEVEQQIYFDCAKISSNYSTLELSDTIERATTGEDSASGDTNPFDDPINNKGRSLAIIFDEFQNCRTIDEEGKEVDRSGITGIWSLIDSGIIDSEWYNYSLEHLKSSLKSLEGLSEIYPNTKIKNLVIQENRKSFQNDYWYCAGKPNIKPESNDFWKIIDDCSCNTIGDILDRAERGLGRKVINKLYCSTTIKELMDVVDSNRKLIFRPRLINCSRSLIFIIGNIDEAYSSVYGNLSPDEDADSIRKITLNISTPVVKDALRYRFRVEQLSRLGNNIITYPTLGKEHFKQLIENELIKLSKLVNVPITFDQNIKDLLYNEGVYPTQGARPVLSTVYDIIFPRISEMIINGLGERVEMSSENLKETSIIHTKIYYSDGSTKELQYEYKLTLGKIRNNKSDRAIEVLAIHEAGHAVVGAILFGEAPINIVGLTASGDGLTTFESFEPITIRDVDNMVIRGLAGYYAEKLFIKTPEDNTLGSSADIRDAWNLLSDAAYRRGYFSPDLYVADPRKVSGEGVPLGRTDRSKDALLTFEDQVNIRFDYLKSQAEDLVNKEQELIRKTSECVIKNRVVSGEEFKKLIKDYARTFSLESMAKVKEAQNYIKVL